MNVYFTICTVQYKSVIARHMEHIEEVRKDEQLLLPDNIDYMRLAPLFFYIFQIVLKY